MRSWTPSPTFSTSTGRCWSGRCGAFGGPIRRIALHYLNYPTDRTRIGVELALGPAFGGVASEPVRRRFEVRLLLALSTPGRALSS